MTDNNQTPTNTSDEPNTPPAADSIPPKNIEKRPETQNVFERLMNTPVRGHWGPRTDELQK
jgi:hypothetical protein